MPYRAPSIRGCGCIKRTGEMCQHQRARKAEAERRRPSSRDRGYSSKWEKETKAFLAQPENKRCACGCGRMANCVDHIVAHKGDQRLFWSRSNWRAMNLRCNSRKAARDEGGFGNKPGRGVSSNFPGGHRNRVGRTAQDRDEISFSAPVTK